MTYGEIRKAVAEQFGYNVKNCWIADVKEQMGLTSRTAWNRKNSSSRVCPCPQNKVADVKSVIEAFRN